MFCCKPFAEERINKILALVVCGLVITAPGASSGGEELISLESQSGACSINVEGRTILRVRYGGGYSTLEERAKVIAQSLAKLFQNSQKVVNFYVVWEKGRAIAFADQNKLFTVLKEDARVNKSDPLSLALSWLNNVQMEFYRIREKKEVEEVTEGIASWCSNGFEGRTTASGEIYTPYAFTAAHRTFPMGSVLLVTNLEDGRKVVVRVNDRGPWKEGRIVDLSLAAAKVLDIHEDGLSEVKVEVLRWGE